MKWKALAIILFFFAAAGIRLMWGQAMHAEQPKASNGILDLRDWNLTANRTVPLNGEWAFYLGRFLPPDGAAPDENAVFVRVPGGWDREQSSPFGYGTYRLTIRLPDYVSEQSLRLALKPTIIRSAHTLYVNGERLGGNGTPDIEAAQAKAQVMPYMVDFYADGDLIQLDLHVSNFRERMGAGAILFEYRESEIRDAHRGDDGCGRSGVVLAASLDTTTDCGKCSQARGT